MPAPLASNLTTEELKALLRRSLAQAGCEPELLADLVDFVLSITRFGYAAFLEFLEYVVPALSPPPAPPIPMEEWQRLNEQALLAFDARLQELPPTYQPGDQVVLHGEVFAVHSYQRGEGMTGYWLRRGREELFLPSDWEDRLRPVTH